MLGVAMALVDSGAMDALAGRVVLFAVPAEEYVDLEYRARLRDEGRIAFFGGKPELVRLGHFDDVDLAMMVHASANTPERRIRVGGTTNGFAAKTIKFRGKASHAGARPDLGINALNAAALAIMGINAQRETFRDEDAVRVHHILTAGGDSVNVVPDDVRMELFARGRSLEAIRDAASKVSRAVTGAAQMVGAEVEILDLPGYLPLVEEQVMAAAFRENAARVLGPDQVLPGSHVAASTDMGALTLRRRLPRHQPQPRLPRRRRGDGLRAAGHDDGPDRGGPALRRCGWRAPRGRVVHPAPDQGRVLRLPARRGSAR